jgi:hypothetical protein
MASGSTARLALPYPLPSDPTNVPGDVQALATALDSAVTAEGAGLLSARPAAGTAGRIYRASDVPALYWDNGATWDQIWPPLALPGLVTYAEKLRTVALSGGIATLDLSLSNEFKVNLTANATIAFTNVPATSGLRISVGVTLVQDGTGSRTVSYPGAVDWGTNGAPILSTGANKIDYVGFITDTNGASWMGFFGAGGF